MTAWKAPYFYQGGKCHPPSFPPSLTLPSAAHAGRGIKGDLPARPPFRDASRRGCPRHPKGDIPTRDPGRAATPTGGTWPGDTPSEPCRG